MTLNISVPDTTEELRPKITIVGVGGAGGNAVNTMIGAQLEGVEFLVANTDGQSLSGSLAGRKVQLGRQHTHGLGAGSKPEVGREAAEESIDDILAELADSHMVFITAGMGGGTGTGAAPVIARACRERGILTVGVITKPFDFEGPRRMAQANAGLEELQAYVDTLIVIPNQNLFRLANERTTFADAFAVADQVLHQAVCGITDLMVKPGLINLDFADVRAIMAEMGKAMMGTGEASGESKALHAADAAINNPLLDETSLKGAQAVLINISGGNDMTLFEVDEAANHIRREVDADATIIFGTAFDEKLDGIMRVTVVATGMHQERKTDDIHLPGESDLLASMGRLHQAHTPPPQAHVATGAREEVASPAAPAATPAPAPAASLEAEPEANGGAAFSHDPDQQNLMDMVDDAKAADARAAAQYMPEARGEATEATGTTEAQHQHAAPHAHQGDTGGNGLINHISRFLLGRKQADTAAHNDAGDQAHHRGKHDPVLTASEDDHAEAEAEQPMQEQAPVPQAQAPAETPAQAPAPAPVPESAPAPAVAETPAPAETPAAAVATAAKPAPAPAPAKVETPAAAVATAATPPAPAPAKVETPPAAAVAVAATPAPAPAPAKVETPAAAVATPAPAPAPAKVETPPAAAVAVAATPTPAPAPAPQAASRVVQHPGAKQASRPATPSGQAELEINADNGDIDLEIPAFLRRQAN